MCARASLAHTMSLGARTGFACTRSVRSPVDLQAAAAPWRESRNQNATSLTLRPPHTTRYCSLPCDWTLHAARYIGARAIRDDISDKDVDQLIALHRATDIKVKEPLPPPRAPCCSTPQPPSHAQCVSANISLSHPRPPLLQPAITTLTCTVTTCTVDHHSAGALHSHPHIHHNPCICSVPRPAFNSHTLECCCAAVTTGGTHAVQPKRHRLWTFRH
jgi:hypothetical protein